MDYESGYIVQSPLTWSGQPEAGYFFIDTLPSCVTLRGVEWLALYLSLIVIGILSGESWPTFLILSLVLCLALTYSYLKYGGKDG